MKPLIKKITFPILVLTVIAATFSCKDQTTGPDNQSSIVFPDSNISYSASVDPLFQQRCALVPCHGSSAQGGLNLEFPSYSNLMNHQPRLVVSFEGNNSLLVERLDGRIQPQMPSSQSPLSANQLNGIKRWINEGALNN